MRQLDEYIDGATNRIANLFSDGEMKLHQLISQQVDRIAERLDKIGGHIEDGFATNKEHFSYGATGQANAAGAATVELTPGVGRSWRVENLTTVVVGGATSIATVYVESVQPINARKLITDADFFTDDQTNIWVHRSGKLIVVFAGCPANAQVQVGVQVEQERANP